MDFILKIILIFTLLGITIQDFTERKVFLWLIIFSGLIVSFFHFRMVYLEQFTITTIVNFSIVIFIIIVLLAYSTFLLKKRFNTTFGLGDFLFFLVLAIGFPTVTFLIIFCFSLIFSLTIYFFLKKRFKNDSIPLAGLQAAFLCIVLIINWVLDLKNLYIL